MGAAGAGIVLPDIGASYQGGFFVGTISHNANGIATHGLIVAPAASGYNGKTRMQWKTANTTTTGTTSPYDGAANSASMNNATHPAAQYCEGLSIGGYSDWYLPSRYELDIAYENLKPTTNINITAWGINDYSVPKRTSNRTSGTPAQTNVAVFQTGGAEAFLGGGHWSSTEAASGTAWELYFLQGDQYATTKTDTSYVRAFRRFTL